MTFNSIEFVIFFVIVFSLYYFILKEKTKLQNVLLLAASYVFYAWASWKILFLLVVTTAVIYICGIAIFEAKTEKRKQLYTVLGIIFGIGMLLYFKYTNFFISSFQVLFESLGLRTNLHTFKILVPFGISYYTFRLLSYIIDIKRGKIEPTRNMVVFATYVAFFPCILSGPIDRPITLIPQLQRKRTFDDTLAVDGMRQILWGLFKKVVIADNCAIYVDIVFGGDDQMQAGSTLILAAVFYSFQLYADFSGYSDMAIGIAKLLGFRITKNFDFPFFSQNIAEYWRKWHISLTSWLTEYIFMPLNIRWRDRGNWGTIWAVIITFSICGLWHGDDWTFVIWGLYQGLLYIPLVLSGAMFKKNRIETYQWGCPKPKVLLNILLTFGLVTAGLVLFRAENMGQAAEFFGKISKVHTFFHLPVEMAHLMKNLFFITCMMTVEWMERKNQYGFEKLGTRWKPVFRYLLYYAISFLIILSMGKDQKFIYFQF